MQEPEADAPFSANWNVMELMLPLIINILPDLCRLSDEIRLHELITVCIQRYMRECVMLKPSRSDQAVGGIAGASGLPESTFHVLCNVKKLVKSLLLLCPEAYLALARETQTAWRLIESESSVRAIDADALKSVLRKAGTNAIVGAPNMQVPMPWSQDSATSASRLVQECEFEKLIYEYVDALDKCCRHAGGCDVQKLKEMLEVERERDREQLRQQSPAIWQKVFQEHSRARSLVHIMCTWCVSHCREHMGESIYMVSAVLKGLSDVLLQVFVVEPDASDLHRTGSAPGTHFQTSSIW